METNLPVVNKSLIEIKEFCFTCLKVAPCFNIYELDSVRTVCKECGKTVDFQIKEHESDE